MAKLKNEKEYRAALKRIDELLPITGDGTPDDDPNMLELDIISDLVEEYELVHYPIGKPSLSLARTMSQKLNIEPDIVLGV